MLFVQLIFSPFPAFKSQNAAAQVYEVDDVPMCHSAYVISNFIVLNNLNTPKESLPLIIGVGALDLFFYVGPP